MPGTRSTFTPGAKHAFAELLRRIEEKPGLDVASAIEAEGELANELWLLWSSWRRLEGHLGSVGSDPLTLARIERELAGPVRADDEVVGAIDRIVRRGSQRGRYTLGDRIGRGGMGVVYRALDHDLGREVALKVVRTSSRAEAQRTGERLLREARLAARIDHPGIVPVYDVGIDEQDRLYYSMRLVDGVDLGVVLAECRNSRRQNSQASGLEVLIKVADAVARAHACGVVHRDLKPANVLVGRFGDVSVTDFGVATALEPSSSSARSTEVAGTPAYMAPEQARGEAAGTRADVYSIGAILYELLSGRRPYHEHEALGFDAVLAALRAQAPADIEKLTPLAPPELAAVVRKAMARAPDDRYATADELASDLRAYVEGRVVRAHASGALAELSKWIARNRALAVTAALALVLAVAGSLAIGWIEARGKAEILRLADVQRLLDLERRAASLWPATPERVASMRAWLEDAEDLAARRSEHEAALAKVEPRDPSVDEARSGDAESRWRTTTLRDLVHGLARFEGEDGAIASVRARITLADELERTALVDATETWSTTIEAIADRARSPRYRGLVVRRQAGLVPLGRDPASDLWEFAVLASGEVPARADDGRLVLTAHSAIVLVLIPPGAFEMGSRISDPVRAHEPRGDPLAREDETPPHVVEVGAFFLAKHEITRAQWDRARDPALARHRQARGPGTPTNERSEDASMRGRIGTEQHSLDPSTRAPDPSAHAGAAGVGALESSESSVATHGALRPADGMSWHEARERLARIGLVLPTEAEWEYAARGDRTTRWSSGDQPGALAGHANGARSDGELPPGARTSERALRIGRLRANPFGLHDVHGNLAEWTADRWRERYGLEPVLEGHAVTRVARGGSFASSVAELRSAARACFSPETKSPEIGLRPARALDP